MDTTILDFKPRTKKEVKEALNLLKFIEVQATLQRNCAANHGDIMLVYMMESERVGTSIAKKAMLWALNLSDNLLDPGVVANYVQKAAEDNIINE
jgi:hypothetical protein